MSRYAFTLGGRTHHVVLEEHADGPRFVIEDRTFQPTVEATEKGTYRVSLDGRSFTFTLRDGHIDVDGAALDMEIRRARPALVRKAGAGRKADGRIKPPMPGKVVEIHVREGDTVEEGSPLVVLEAMKMQNDVKSPMAGTVSKVHVSDGQNVEATSVMLEIEPEPVDGEADA